MMKGFKEGFMNTFKKVMYGIVAAGVVLASSGCHESNRHSDNNGYYRDGSRYGRNDRRWDDDNYRDRRYSRPDRRDWQWDRN
jgi:hypothetical protein